jgi:hypothetical protein
MKSSNMMWGLIVSFILVFGTAAPGHATATVTVSSPTYGQVAVQGAGFDGVGAIEIDIQYDATALANPTVTQGSLISGMPTVTHNAPGLFSFTGVDPYLKTRTGSGSIATITFDTVGNALGTVTVSARLLDTTGVNIPVQPNSVHVIVAGSGSGSGSRSGSGAVGRNSSGSDSGTPPPPVAATSTTNPTYLGTVTMPDTGTAAVAKTNEETPTATTEAEKSQKQTSEVAAKENAPPVAKAAPQTVTEEKGASLTGSVLERFRVFEGEKTPKNLIALFRSAMTGSTQEPNVALSDGKTIVKMSVDLPAASKSEPEFALKEAKLVSLSKTGDSTWVVKLLPNKGTLEASVIVMVDGKMAELPLTVAPPISADPKTGKARMLTEADFAAFLKQDGAGDGARSDLNSDGNHDYIDDYIYAANFLVQSGAAKTAPEKKPQEAKP